MSDTQKSQTLSWERRRHLLELGAVVVERFAGFSLGGDGVCEGAYGKWAPREEPAPLEALFAAMRLAGMDPGQFKFQQYDVMAANPLHGNRVDLKFPAQMVIKGEKYTGLHEVDLVLRSPFITVAEIQAGSLP